MSGPRFGAAVAALLGILLIAIDTAAAPPPFNGERRPFTVLSRPAAAPLIPMHTADGGVTNLSRYRGRVVLLNLWATWCPACVRELPGLDRLQADLGGADFTVLTLSVDAAGSSQVLPYLRRHNIRNLPALMDPAGRAAAAFGVGEGLPWSFIIDRRGRLRGYLMGAADWDSAAARRLVKYFLAEK